MSKKGFIPASGLGCPEGVIVPLAAMECPVSAISGRRGDKKAHHLCGAMGLDDYPEDQLPGLGFGLFKRGSADITYNYGGNLEVSPPVTVGSEEYLFGPIIYGGAASGSQRPEDDITEFLAAQGIQDPIEVDTSWLYVGHVDEVISFVLGNTARGFKMLVASPYTAVAILWDLHEDNKGDLLLCEGKLDREGWPVEATVDEILGDDDFMIWNSVAQGYIASVRSELVNELDLNDPEDIVEVPVLFEVRVHDLYGLTHVAYTPNMVNLLTVSNYHLVIPMPFGPEDGGVDEFEYRMFDQLYWLGLTLHWIDDWYPYHNWNGEVHCGTNARRSPSTTHHWWEQESEARS